MGDDNVAQLGMDASGFNQGVNQVNLILQQLNQNISNTTNNLIQHNSVVNTTNVIMKQTAVNVQTVSQRFAQFASNLGAFLARDAILDVIRAIQGSVDESNAFARQLAEIGTISQNSGKSLEDFRAHIIDVSNTFGLARKDVAEGVYQTLSNQIGDANDAMLFTQEAAKFSQAAVSTQTDSVNLLSSAIKSFNLKATDSNEIAASFFKTIELGRLRASDLANSYGTVGVIANQLGITYNEVNASLAQLTIRGVTAANAQVFLRNFFISLIKPSKDLKAVFDKYGFSSGQAAVQTLGLTGTLKLLSEEIGSNVEKFGDLEPNIRALQPLLTLASDGGSEFVKTLKKIEGGLDSYNKAVDIVGNDSSTKFTKIFTALNNEVISVGDAVRKTVVAVVDSFGGIENAIKTLKDVLIGGLIASIPAAIAGITALAATFPAATAAVLTFNAALLANPLTAIAVGLGLAITGLLIYKDSLDRVVEDYAKAIEETQKTLNLIDARRNEAAQKAEDAHVQIVGRALANITAEYQKLEEKAVKVYKNIGEETKTLGESLVQSQNRIIRNLENQNNKSADVIKRAQDQNAKDIIKLEDTRFNRSIEGATIQLELEQRSLEIVRLKEQLSSQLTEGDNNGALATLGSIEKQQTKIEDLSKTIQKVTKEFNDFTTETIKSSFDLQTRIVDLSYDKISKTFDKLKKAIKDVNDKTGDRTNINSSFLRTFVKELDIAGARTDASANRLIRNLDRLQSKGKVPILDPETQELLSSLDRKTVKELKFRIRIGDTESVNKILDSVKEARKEQDDFDKDRIANEQAFFLFKKAEEANRNADFEAERKFLNEARSIREKIIKDPAQAQQDFVTFTDQISNSFRDQLTVKAKQKQEENSIFETIQNQIKAQSDVNRVIKQRQGILEGIIETEELNSIIREDEIDQQRKNVVALQSQFRALNDLKIKPKTNLEQVRESLEEFDNIAANLDKLIQGASLNDFTVLEKAKDDIKAQLIRERTALEAIEDNKSKKEEIGRVQQTVNLERDIRKKAIQELQNELDKIRLSPNLDVEFGKQLDNIDSKILGSNLKALGQSFLGQVKGNPLGLGSAEETGKQIGLLETSKVELQDELKIKKELAQFDLQKKKDLSDTIKLLNTVQEGGKIDVTTLTPEQVNLLQTALNTIQTSGLTDEVRARLKTNLDTLFDTTNVRTQKLIDQLLGVKRQAEEPIKPEVDLTGFDLDIAGMREKIESLNDIVIKPRVQIGGVGGGDNPDFTLPGFASGGIVPGNGFADSVLAALTPGEIVLPRSLSNRVISDFNQNRIPGRSISNSVNMNGINIHVHSTGGSKVVARELASELSRLAKRGIIKI
jgi:TP901 family phage tail tape measure protein